MPQAKNFVLSGGAATITAPCGGSVFRIIGSAAFNVTYADGGQRIGSAAPAVDFGGGSFIFDVVSPLGSAFAPEQIVAYVTGGGVQTVSVVPVVAANKPLVLQTNGSSNATQNKLNLVGAGTVAITDDGNGNVTFDDSGAELIGINNQTDSYTLALTDIGKLVRMNKATGNNLTVPLNATVAFPVGTSIAVRQVGVGVTTLVATGGVTLNNPGSDLHLAKQWATCQLIKVATDTWDIIGGTTGA